MAVMMVASVAAIMFFVSSFEDNDRSVSFAAALTILGISVPVIYFWAAMGFNHTELRISNGRLTVRHRPFPLRPGVSLPTEAITQLFCARVAHGVDSNGRASHYSFGVFAVLNNTATRKLLDGLSIDEPDVARQLETEIESFLGLRDVNVWNPQQRIAESEKKRILATLGVMVLCGLLGVGVLLSCLISWALHR